MKKPLLFVAGLFLPIMVQAADIQYVSDQLVITLRSGQGSQYQILRTLPTGTRLEILEMTDTGYAKARTPQGLEGWVRTQYLSPEPVAKDKLAVAEKKLERLRAQNSQLKEEVSSLRQQHTELASERDNLLNQSQSAKTEVERLNEVAAKPILLDKQNRELKQQNVSLEKELQLMQQENQVLKDRSQREWFIAGAGVLLGGMLLGLVVPKIRWRKKSNW